MTSQQMYTYYTVFIAACFN